MGNLKKIIMCLCCIELLLAVSSLAAAISGRDNVPSTWDLVRQEMTKKAEPNEPLESPEPVQPTESVEPAKSVESAKAPVAAETVESLLDKYTKTVAKYKTSYLSRAEDTSEANMSMPSSGFTKGIYKQIYKVELRSDSKNYFNRRKNWGDNPHVPSGKITENDIVYNISLWTGELNFQTTSHPAVTKPKVRIRRKEDLEETALRNLQNGITCNGQVGGPIRGFFDGSDVTIDKELRNADTITVRPKKEKIKGSDCFVIDAKDKRSKFTIWIDPEHDYNIVQAKIRRNSAGDSSQLDLKNVVFKEIDGIWVPIECDYNMSHKYDSGEYFSEDHHHKITEYLINPDHKSLKSFDPNSFVENGAPVNIINASGGQYTWKDGKVIDSYGYEVNLSTMKPPSLVGKTLPSIAEFGIDLNPDVFKNNRLLICFFDYSQRPSRNCVLSLNEKAESLLDKDIFLIFIQAEPVTEQTLAAWLTKNEIVPPVGTSKIDLPALGHSWGVESLPWLILTDKQHIVTSEGFSITALDEKIED
ncbi:MAG: hypothetical protein JXA96_12885 [Sedimentisphaerales bacterium]|nr:hypothetical protein [Sedimentisphaerales bacterium]